MSVLVSYQTRPAAHKLSSSAWPAEIADKFKEWKWVLVDELIGCLNGIMERKGSARWFMGPYALLSGFVLLNKRIEAEDLGLFTWVTRTSFALHERLGPNFPDKSTAIYIPERWSNLIIEMVEQGIVSISSRPDVREGGRICGHDLIAHFPDKSTKWLHWQGHDKYKIEEMPEHWKAAAST